MKFSLLLGTYGSRLKELDILFDSIERQTYKNFELIVGSQSNHDEIDKLLQKHSFDYKHIHVKGKGISLNRNAIMPYATGDVYTFTDDDCWYMDNTLETVKGYFEKYNPDVATFQHYDPNLGKSTAIYPEKEILGIKKLKLLKLMTLDLWFNAKTIDPKTHHFDERFGVGTGYNSGEENIYLMDLYNEGIRKFYYFPERITYHPFKPVNYIDEKSMLGKGPLFKRLFGTFNGFVLFTAFCIKKRGEIKKNNGGRYSDIIFPAIKEQFKFKK